MLVGRIARPMAARRDHFDHQQALGRRVLRQHVADVAGVRACRARGLDLARRDHPRRQADLRRARVQSATSQSSAASTATLAMRRDVDRPRQAGEDIGALADHPGIEIAGAHPRLAGENDEAQFASARRQGEALALFQRPNLEADIAPAGAFGRHAEQHAAGGGAVRMNEQVGHGRLLRSGRRRRAPP